MEIHKLTPTDPQYPDRLRHIPKPPAQLFYAGAPPGELLRRPSVAIVGSRKVSAYGRQVTLQFGRELAEQGIVIVSGLALGVDGLAHQAALDAGGQVIAVLPSPLTNIVPATNYHLAQRILATGGSLVSEYSPEMGTHIYNFVNRNRLVCGLAQATLITEAAEHSGSLHTAEFTLDQGKDVLAVPGNITSLQSVGVNNWIKKGNAQAVTTSLDVMRALGIESIGRTPRRVRGSNPHEQCILDLLVAGVQHGEELLAQSELSVSEFNQALTMLEIGSKVRPLGANQWALY